MHDTETRAIMTLALLAAYADGTKDERERASLGQVANALGSGNDIDMVELHREVLMSKPSIQTVAAGLQTIQARQLAYETAVAVCNADGLQTPGEVSFLAELAKALQLPGPEATAFAARADEIAAAAIPASGRPADAAATTSAAPATDAAAAEAARTAAQPSAPAIDELILNASITNAALELLPETLASLAIIPLQMRLVYRIGHAYGYTMDRTHAKDFIATLGVGLASQYVEQFGRKLLGGLLGGVGGGLGRGIGRQAASSGLTFATTYAIGRVAQRYYSGGQTLDAQTLKSTFAGLLAEARALAPKYLGDIERRAGTIDPRGLADLIRQV